MANCTAASKIQTNIAKACDPNPQGVVPIIWVGYVSQLATVVFAADKKTITAFTLKTGETLKTIEGFKLSNALSLGFNATDYANYVTHLAQIVVFDRGVAGRLAVDSLKDANDLFVIAKQNGLYGLTEAYGITAGMKCVGLTSALNDANGGAYVLSFQADQELYTPPVIKPTTGDVDTMLKALTLQ